MAANINQNRYRIILLLYLVFICLSLLSVPKSLLESNLYMIRTLTFQDSILGRQLGYLNDSAKAIMKRTRFQNSRLQNERFLSTQERISGVYAFADSVDRGLLSFFAAANTSIDKEYSKKRMITAYFESDSVLSRLQASLFSLAGFLQTADSALGKQFAQQLPASLQIVSRTKKAYSWQRYFILEKPASVAYMHLKRIKLLMLQTGIQLAERRIAASQKNYRSISLSIPPPAPVTPNLATDPKELKIDSLSRSAASIPEQLRNEILNTIRLDRYYVGIPTVLLAATEKLNLKDVEIILLPEARLINTSDRVQVLFSAPGQYQLSVYYKNAASRPLVLQRKINADRLPDPLVRVNLEGNTRNVIRSEDLSRVNRLVATIPVVGLPNVMLRVNGFRGTIVGEGGEKSSVYNYGQVFQESMRELLNSLQQGDLLLLDNITVAVGDGSTRSASPILYKIVN
jgi:hypothetical protein